jgi:hypothetical protein
MHFDTQSCESVRKDTWVWIEPSESWRHSSKTNPPSNAPFQHDTLSNTIENTYENELSLQLQSSLFLSEHAYEPYWAYIIDIGIEYTDFILITRRPTSESRAYPVQQRDNTRTTLTWITVPFLPMNPGNHLLSKRCSYSFVYHEEDKILRKRLPPKVSLSEARYAYSRRSSVPLRAATPDSTLRCPRYIHCNYTILLLHVQLQDCRKTVCYAKMTAHQHGSE